MVIKMKMIYLKENSVYTIEDLMKLFDIFNQNEMNDLIFKLYTARILKKKKKEDVDLDLLVSDVEEDLYSENFDTIVYVFSYVGAIQLYSNYCLLIYPKYMVIDEIHRDVDNRHVKFRQIMDVLENYSYNLSQSISQSNATNKGFHDNLGIQTSLLKDYYNNGLYYSQYEEISVNGPGKVLWNRTITQSQAYILNNIPIYLDNYTLDTKSNDEDIIKLIHMIILSEISRTLDPILDIFEWEKIFLSDIYLKDFMDNETINYILTNELNAQYVTSKRNTISLMLRYLNDSSSVDESELILLGTRAFNLVWEDVCSANYSNVLDKTFDEVGLNTPSLEFKYEPIRTFVEKPIWCFENGANYIAKSTLKLDVLSIQENSLNIYDAKYYVLNVRKTYLRGEPGINDITKQYLYELAFKEIIDMNKLDVTNQFIMPIDDSSLDNKEIGTVELKMFENLGLKPIKIILRDTETMFIKYLKT